MSDPDSCPMRAQCAREFGQIQQLQKSQTKMIEEIHEIITGNGNISGSLVSKVQANSLKFKLLGVVVMAIIGALGAVIAKLVLRSI